MDHFEYRDGELHAESVPLRAIAERFGTPCYIYSRATLERHWWAFDRAFGERPHLVCYAVKANSNLAVLNVLAKLGSGFDIVSVGELERVLAAGGDPAKVVFSGVGKREDELRRALQVGIRCFNVEVPGELDRLDRIAGELGVKAPVSLRVNPDVDAKTHPYISTGLKENKFGIDIDAARDCYRHAAGLPNLAVVGIDCHIGSQLTEVEPFIDALARVLKLAEHLREDGIAIHHLDMGGGLGIRYSDEFPPEPSDYASALSELLAGTDYEILMEPGRAIVGNAGVLLTKVEYLKSNRLKNFAIVDAAMNDLIRPALYDAYQTILPVKPSDTVPAQVYDIVGPVCETGDFLGKERELAIREGDLLAVRSAGAYGSSMGSNYNSRPRPPEVLVDGEQILLVRQRETLADLFRDEILPG
ncbi:diaminopimelate decarboxylase [Methylomagnum ishizawai]|uniref:Diaminopimelate decarboxylase n=1 Tax=Methylomagnum ishizawai TaxID=1760988 RepID=A0A1Y6CXB8_9GAMM|nr:diaminopimelate decarboxylase [Methylomagnum ishizawai]SMF95308.1 diaminopimelate decarboxylase [Methylomagnum ishizawai]